MRERRVVERWSKRGRARVGLAAGFLALAAAGCGSDPIIDDNPAEVAPFVGTWDAEVFEVTSIADPSTVADLMVNGIFNIDIQPSGNYRAILTFGGIPLTEFGQISVSDGFITLRPTGGTPATSAYVFIQPDYLQLDGPTEFDFNLDEMPDPAQAHIEIRRR